MPVKKSLSYPRWVKLGNIRQLAHVGKETIAVGCGCHILFYSLEGNIESIYIANSQERGDGVACLAGHFNTPIFAFAEKCLNPRILIFSYPAVEGAIAILKGGPKGPYISMAFSELEYLVTLSGIPQFMIVVWCWRTGLQMACKDTAVTNPAQCLSCSLSSSGLICQLVEKGNFLIVWELNVCAKLCCLTRKDVDLPENSKPTSACFTTEGLLLYVDTQGDVFQVDLDEYTAIKRTFSSSDSQQVQNALYPPCIVSYKAGILVAGPTSSLKFIRRSDWAEQWNLNLMIPIQYITCLVEADIVLGWTYSGELVMIDCGKQPQVKLIKYYGNDFVDMQLVLPNGNTIATLNARDMLQIWEKENGKLLGEISIRTAAEESFRKNSQFTSLSANPCYPYVGVSMTDGLLLLISALRPKSPVILARFLLCSEEISMVRFAPAGDVFVAVTAKSGQFFLIQGVPGQDMQVVAHLLLYQSVVDCTLLPDVQPVIAVLLSETNNERVGSKIVLYVLESDGLHPDVTSTMENNYARLINTNIKNICIGVVNCSRKIHMMEIRTKLGTKVKDSIATGHQLRHIRVSENVDYGLLTYGMDGAVIARPKGSRQQFYTVLPHHRTDLGVLRSVQDPKGEFVISLGRDKSLVCSKLKRTAHYAPESIEATPQMQEIFSEPTTGFFLDGEYSGLTWLEYRERVRIQEEERQAAPEKSQILQEFRLLRQKIVEMLDSNESAPPEEQLPVSAFELDKDARESAIEEGRQLREHQKQHTQATISLMESKSKLIREHCWEPVKIKPTSIQSLVGQYKVENYSLLPNLPITDEQLEIVIERRKLEIKSGAADSFQPWISKTDSELEMQLTNVESTFAPVDETTRIMQALQEDSASKEESVTECESPYVMSGSSVSHYIEPSPYHISQFELSTYLQVSNSIVLLQKDITNLQEWFNKEFHLMYEAKEREMATVKDLHQRLRYIFRELLLSCSVTHPDPDPEDPQWSQYERPEMILTVADDEVGVEMYISPSQQELRAKIAEEEERQRLLLLADNFRELALLKMMDGVLEIRWQDELKKDVPKPKCMLEKEPEDFNEDDLRAVKDYEDKVVNLMKERDHYRKILISDYGNVKQNLKESISKFEQKLLQLFDLKLRVEAACSQHTLRILRSRLHNPKRMLLVQKENSMREMIAANQKALAEEQTLVAQLQDALGECRAAFETQTARDKSLDAKFRKEFPELSPMMIEMCFRLYRKRPKMHARAFPATLLNELGRCALTGKKPPYMPSDCIDILKGIDALDNAANAPPNLHAESWANVCRLRRQRIDSEIKIQALALQMAEAENTVTIFQRNVKILKEKDRELQTQLRAVHDEQLLFEHDVEVQIVMKQGLVEIPINGKITDFEHAILINRKDVAEINEVIKAAGRNKLKAMKAACNFRRGIIFKEWEHRKMKMHIEDREDELKTIESVKVTKEVQEWLRKKKRGVAPDKGMLSLDKEIARIRSGFEKYIKTLNEIVKDYNQRIALKNRVNKHIDRNIAELHIELENLQFERDVDNEKETKEQQKKRMDVVVLRTTLVRQVHSLHLEILNIESELENLRLRTYPILENNT